MTFHAGFSAISLRPCPAMPCLVENKNSRHLNTRFTFSLQPEVVTKLGTLHSASTRPPFRLCASFRRDEICTRPQARLPANGQTRKPEDWLAPGHPRDRTAHRSTPPSLPLHSGSQVSSLLGIEWCDQNGVGFSAKGLRTQRRSRRKSAGARPTVMFAGDNFAGRGILAML
jgi:hypothetical protein